MVIWKIVKLKLKQLPQLLLLQQSVVTKLSGIWVLALYLVRIQRVLEVLVLMG